MDDTRETKEEALDADDLNKSRIDSMRSSCN